MAKKVQNEGGAPPKNGIDEEKLKSFFSSIQGDYAELETRRGEYMADCKAIREGIREKFEAASDAGIPRRALKAALRLDELEDKIEKLSAEMDMVEKASYNEILAKLGMLADTPLGAAAAAKAPDAPKQSEERERRAQETAAKERAEMEAKGRGGKTEAAKAIEAGIKQKPEKAAVIHGDGRVETTTTY